MSLFTYGGGYEQGEKNSKSTIVRVDQICEYIVDNECQLSHCWREELKIRKGERSE